MAAYMLKQFSYRQCCFAFILHRSVVKRRYLCTNTSSSSITAVLLGNKSHIKVSGEDAVSFLNGLLTNDINLFNADSRMSVLYSMMLNSKGRVLYDLLVYKLAANLDVPTFLLECDSAATSAIIKTITLYKLRSQVEFSDVSQQFRSWSVIDEGARENLERRHSKSFDNLVLVEDPRLGILGARLLLPRTDVPSEYYRNITEELNQDVYDAYRVRNGVGEGLKDIEPGVALPLEYNITELCGVSFHKGCYVGQELTARTHHTGVLRKRIMPVKLTGNNGTTDPSFDKDASIKTVAGKVAGKLKSTYRDGSIGLALLRLGVVKAADGLSVSMSNGSDVSVLVDWPSWWSHE